MLMYAFFFIGARVILPGSGEGRVYVLYWTGRGYVISEKGVRGEERKGERDFILVYPYHKADRQTKKLYTLLPPHQIEQGIGKHQP